MASFIPNKTNTQCAKRLQTFKLQWKRAEEKQQRLLLEQEKQRSQLSEMSESKRAPQMQHQQPSLTSSTYTVTRSNILDSQSSVANTDIPPSSLRDRDSFSKTPASATAGTGTISSFPHSATSADEATAVAATTNEGTPPPTDATEFMDEIDVIPTMFAAAELTTSSEVITDTMDSTTTNTEEQANNDNPPSSKNGSATTLSNTVGGSDTSAAPDSASSSLVVTTATTSTVERTIGQGNPRGPPPSSPPCLPVNNDSRNDTTTIDTCNETTSPCTSSDHQKQPLSLSPASSQTPTNNSSSNDSTSPPLTASPTKQHQESCDQKNRKNDDENSKNDNNVHDDDTYRHSSATKVSDNESGSGDTRTATGSSTPTLQPASSTAAPLLSTPIEEPEQEQQEECTTLLKNAASFPLAKNKYRKKQDGTHEVKASSSSCSNPEQTNGDFTATATRSTKNKETATATARRYPDTVRPLWWVRDIRRGKITAVKSGGGYAQMSFSTTIDTEKKKIKTTKLKTELEQLDASFNDISQQQNLDEEDTPSERPIRQSTSIQRALGSNWRLDDTLQLNQHHLQHQQQQQRTSNASSRKRKYPPDVSAGVSAETAIELDLTDESSVASSTYLSSSSSSSSSLLSSEARANVDVDADVDCEVEDCCDNIGDNIYTGSDVEIFPTLYRKKSVDPVTELPVEDFAVCKVDDDPKTPKYIYKFRSFVAKSRIDAECAGNGAFIAFIGAWERPTGEKASLAEAKQPSASGVLDPLSIVNGDDLRPLLALHPMGFNINIFLRLQDTLLNPLPPNQTYHIDWDHQGRSDGDTPLTHDVDVSSYTKEVKGIKEFSLTGQSPAMLELGLYGPRSPSERLKDWEFELKNWIFSSLPGLYAWQSHEFLRGRNASDPHLNDIDQMFDWHPRHLHSFFGETFHSTHLQRDRTLLISQTLDITSNHSGRPSMLSQLSIPMHVNEAGYGKSGNPRVSNTIVFNAGERKTHYLYCGRKLQKATPFSLQKYSVELKVNYGPTYEKYRERKGYGLRNLKGSVLSDQNRPSLLLRNFADRNGAIETIDCLGIRQFYETLEFLETEIHSKIVERFSRRLLSDRQIDDLGTLPAGLASSDVTVEQLVALRRLHWLGVALRNHLQCLQDSGATTRTKSCLVEQCRATIHTLENETPISSAIQSWSDVISFVRNHDYADSHGKKIKDALENELKEEVLFTLQTDLVHPYDEGTWCPIACCLIERLCEATLRQSDRLPSEYFNLAVEAKEWILDENTPLKDLALSSDVVNTRYGLKAAKNRCGATGNLSCVVVHSFPRPVTKIVSTENDEGSATRRSSSLSICDEWYLLRQVLFIVDAFAKKNLSESKKFEFTESLLAHFATHATRQTIRQFLSDSMSIEGEVAEGAFGRITPSRFQNGWQNDQEALPPWVGSDGSASSETTDRAFYELVLPILERKLGWTVEYGDPDWDDQKRTDGLHFCAFPPGIARHEDCSLFRPHINYFASQKEVISRLEREVLPWARFCADYDNTLKNQRGLTFNEVDQLFALWHRNKEVRKRKRTSGDADRTLVEYEKFMSTQDENGPQKNPSILLLNQFI
mmetsp:Transcript_35036/g.84789  ORF Transcript_35036/g.84789 Transcript_35036/m.84789 type:complete len:1580 (+) Transcript_35036:3-4742(+)